MNSSYSDSLPTVYFSSSRRLVRFSYLHQRFDHLGAYPSTFIKNSTILVSFSCHRALRPFSESDRIASGQSPHFLKQQRVTTVVDHPRKLSCIIPRATACNNQDIEQPSRIFSDGSAPRPDPTQSVGRASIPSASNVAWQPSGGSLPSPPTCADIFVHVSQQLREIPISATTTHCDPPGVQE